MPTRQKPRLPNKSLGENLYRQIKWFQQHLFFFRASNNHNFIKLDPKHNYSCKCAYYNVAAELGVGGGRGGRVSVSKPLLKYSGTVVHYLRMSQLKRPCSSRPTRQSVSRLKMTELVEFSRVCSHPNGSNRSGRQAHCVKAVSWNNILKFYLRNIHPCFLLTTQSP